MQLLHDLYFFNIPILDTYQQEQKAYSKLSNKKIFNEKMNPIILSSRGM